MKKITIDGKEIEISDKSFEQLKNELINGSERWRAEVGEEYWFLTEDGDVSWCSDYRQGVDNERWEIGNHFGTEKEAEECIETGWYARRKAEQRIQDYIRENGLEFEPDWVGNVRLAYKPINYHIIYDHSARDLLVASDSVTQYALFYFETEDDAEQVIEDCRKDLVFLLTGKWEDNI